MSAHLEGVSVGAASSVSFISSFTMPVKQGPLLSASPPLFSLTYLHNCFLWDEQGGAAVGLMKLH